MCEGDCWAVCDFGASLSLVALRYDGEAVGLGEILGEARTHISRF